MSESFRTSVDRVSDLASFIDKELGVSAWMQVAQDRINQFADVTEDHQWIHLDIDRAKRDSPYGGTIAHGFLILSLTPHLASQTYHIKHKSMGINYGLDKVRFTNATRSGAFIRARVSLLEHRNITGGAKYKLKVVIEIKDEVKPACVAEMIALVYD